MNTTRALKDEARSTLFRWRTKDTPNGVTKTTASHAAEVLGVNETQLMHMALAQYIAREVPLYDPDFDALTSADLAEIRRRVPQTTKGARVLSSIID